MRRRAPPALALALLPACAGVLLALACSRGQPPSRTDWLLFGSPASLEIRGMDPARADAAAAATVQALAPLHQAWHPWEDGTLTRFNRALASGDPVEVPPPLREPLARARDLHARSDGLFDAGIGGLVALWGFHTSDFPVRSPPPDEAALAAWRADPPSITDLLPLADGRVQGRHPRLQFDFNGIAEGLAAARAAEVLRAAGVGHALLTLGGDVYALGDAGGRPWQVGLRDPHGEVLAGVALAGPAALFASGNYHKYRNGPGGSRWPHVLDPRTAAPATGTAATAVLHPDPVLADAAATALLVGGPDRFAGLVERMAVPCALLLTDDDTLLLTAPMQARIELLRTPARVRIVAAHATGCTRD